MKERLHPVMAQNVLTFFLNSVAQSSPAAPTDYHASCISWHNISKAM